MYYPDVFLTWHYPLKWRFADFVCFLDIASKSTEDQTPPLFSKTSSVWFMNMYIYIRILYILRDISGGLQFQVSGIRWYMITYLEEDLKETHCMMEN